MIAAIRPLLDTQVQHWLPSKHTIHGKRHGNTGSTPHAARVIYTPGSMVGPVSRDRNIDAAAIIWLVNHPRPIAVGDTFELPNGEALNVIRAERRASGADTVSKVFLS